MIKPQKVTVPSGPLALAGLLFVPKAATPQQPMPAVLILHGLGSKKESHAAFAQYLAERGFVSLVMDLRGHGDSAGVLDDHVLDDVHAAISYLASRPEVDGARLAVRGSSMGAYLGIHAAAENPAIQAVVAIAPATEEILLAALAQTKPGRKVVDLTQGARIQRTAVTNFLRARRVADAVRKISPRPLLFIQCRDDELVPATSTERLFALAGEPKSLIMIDGGHHRFAQQDGTIHRHTAEWLAQSLSLRSHRS